MAAYKDTERGTWYVMFYYYDWTGKNRKKMKRGFKNKRDANEWENHFRIQQTSNLDMSFEDFWKVYEQDVRPKLKYNTWLSKETIVNGKILPYFRKKKMKDINARDVIQWQNEMRKLGEDEDKEFSGTYLRTIQAQLSAIFNHAVNFYNLGCNPARKAGTMGTGQADEMLFWTKEEYLKFIPEVANKPYSYYAFELLYWCGIRLGELLALTPNDFDFDTNTLSITKSYQRIKGEDIITTPKTRKSKRRIVMPEMVASEMRDFFDSIYGLDGSDRIFLITKSYLHHEMDRGVKASGVKRIRIHDLRHSHVSLLIDMGFSTVAIGERVGHESEKITYRYAHLFPTVQSEMAAKLDIQWKEGFNNVSEEYGCQKSLA